VIVLDASAALAALLNSGPARRTISDQQLHAPHLLDAEVASGLRRQVFTRQPPSSAAWAALDALRRLALTRYPGFPLAERVWELRETLSAYDATYVALAEALDCSLLTADGRLSRAPGPLRRHHRPRLTGKPTLPFARDPLPDTSTSQLEDQSGRHLRGRPIG
jgi:predicted nucleic acid-binding protein